MKPKSLPLQKNQPQRPASRSTPVLAQLKVGAKKAIQLKSGSTIQTRKAPVAPPVYRPNPTPHVVSPTKTVAGKHQPAIQPKLKPKAPPVYKPVVAKVLQSKLAAPRPFSPAAARNGLVQAKAHSGTGLKPPTSFFRAATIQLLKVKDLETCYVRKPTGDEQIAAHGRCVGMLARHANEEVGDSMDDARINIASLLLARLGGAATLDSKMLNYFLGLTDDMPAAVVSGLGTLSFGAAGVEGRPGFLRSPFEEDDTRGGPGRALRHKTAWHNIREFMNSIHQQYGEEELARICDTIRPDISDRVAFEADSIVRHVKGTPTQMKILWLGIVMNSAKKNLWLGPSKENISINTVVAHLKRWTHELDTGVLDLAAYRAKVGGAQFGSQKAKEVQQDILAIISETAAMPPAEALGHVVQNVYKRALSKLEIDLKNEAERAQAPHHMRFYEIAHGIGGLSDRLQLIRALLDI